MSEDAAMVLPPPKEARVRPPPPEYVPMEGIEGFIQSTEKLAKRLVTYFNDKEKFALCRGLGENFKLVSLGLGVFAFKGLASKDALQNVLSNELVGRYVSRVYWTDGGVSTRRDAIVVKVVELLADQPDVKLRLQTFPSSNAQVFADMIPENIALQKSGFTHILSLVFINKRGSKLYYWGLTPASERYHQNTDARPDTDVCSARFKLCETFFVFGIKPAPTWRFLDVGAAPGSWTSVLKTLVPEGIVVAVDPAELNDDCLSASNVVHLRKKVEDCEAELRRYAPFDAVTCDANVDPRQVRRACMHEGGGGTTACVFKWK
eukprot:Opistho-2@17673